MQLFSGEKTVESFVQRAITSPLRLVCYAMVLYMASQSFVVGGLLALIACSWLYHKIVGDSAKVPAAPDVIVKKPQASPMTETTVQEPEVTQNRYAKSAVVMPFPRTGTHNRP